MTCSCYKIEQWVPFPNVVASSLNLELGRRLSTSRGMKLGSTLFVALLESGIPPTYLDQYGFQIDPIGNRDQLWIYEERKRPLASAACASDGAVLNQRVNAYLK